MAKRGTCSNGSALAWLNSERSKHAIYPHQANYCDTCAQIKESINGMQTSLKRKRHTGSVTEKEQKKIEYDIKMEEDRLAVHKNHASKAHEYYNEMTLCCKEQWNQIQKEVILN